MEAVLPFKYQQLISGLQLDTSCPDGNCQHVEKTVYRFVREDLEEGMSFLPNIPYDERRGRPRRINHLSDSEKCETCGLSFFDRLDQLHAKVKSLGGANRVAAMLEYTHVAEGPLVPADGVATLPKRGHFVFFEYEGVELDNRFQVISPL